MTAPQQPQENNDNMNNAEQHSSDGFFDRPSTISWILRVFYALCIILVLLDFVVHRHIYVDFEKIPTFYALYGFVACVVLVLLAKVMRFLLMRGEDYYEPLNDDDNSSAGSDGRLD
jgi:hypothetical protein